MHTIRLPVVMLVAMKRAALAERRSVNRWIERVVGQELGIEPTALSCADTLPEPPPAPVDPRCPACADVDNGCDPAVYPCKCDCHLTP